MHSVMMFVYSMDGCLCRENPAGMGLEKPPEANCLYCVWAIMLKSVCSHCRTLVNCRQRIPPDEKVFLISRCC